MEKRWVENRLSDEKVISQLADQLNITSIIAELLVNRGITTYEEAEAYFRPRIEHLHDPFLMKDMERAILRIEQAIANQEKILIFRLASVRPKIRTLGTITNFIVVFRFSSN